MALESYPNQGHKFLKLADLPALSVFSGISPQSAGAAARFATPPPHTAKKVCTLPCANDFRELPAASQIEQYTGQPVASSRELLSISYGLFGGIVHCYFGQIGFQNSSLFAHVHLERIPEAWL